MMSFTYTQDRLGFVDYDDWMYVMGDYGFAVEVPYCLESWYFQEH